MSALPDNVVQLRPRGKPESFVSKGALAAHLGMSERWVELRMKEGLPVHRFRRTVRFRISEVEQWLERSVA